MLDSCRGLYWDITRQLSIRHHTILEIRDIGEKLFAITGELNTETVIRIKLLGGSNTGPTFS